MIFFRLFHIADLVLQPAVLIVVERDGFRVPDLRPEFVFFFIVERTDDPLTFSASGAFFARLMPIRTV